MQVLAGLPERLRDCRGILDDSNIVLDVATNDPRWNACSPDALAQCAEHATLLLNPIIYAEISVGLRILCTGQIEPGGQKRMRPAAWLS